MATPEALPPASRAQPPAQVAAQPSSLPWDAGMVTMLASGDLDGYCLLSPMGQVLAAAGRAGVTPAGGAALAAAFAAGGQVDEGGRWVEEEVDAWVDGDGDVGACTPAGAPPTPVPDPVASRPLLTSLPDPTTPGAPPLVIVRRTPTTLAAAGPRRVACLAAARCTWGGAIVVVLHGRATPAATALAAAVLAAEGRGV